MARFFAINSETLRINKALNEKFIQYILNRQFTCFLKHVVFIPKNSTDDIKFDEEFILSKEYVFGEVMKQEDSSLMKLPPPEITEFHHRLKIISLIMGEATYEIGFFESGYQLALSIVGVTNSIFESLENFNNGNTDELIRLLPNIECLLSLIDRMKKDNPILSKLQLEVLLKLFQQLRIDTFDEFTHVRMCIEQWIEKNNQNETELLFSNLGNEKWKSDQLLFHTFFSLAFSDIIGNVKQYLYNYSIAFGSAINNPRYFNILLSALYGNELSRSEWLNSRKCHTIKEFSKEIISVLDDIGITPETCDNENTSFQNYPNCLLNTIRIQYSQFMDPRSATRIVKNIEFKKSNFNKHSFSNYILSDYFIVQYLVRKCCSGETKKEREEYLQELKQIDLSAYYYIKCKEERALLSRLSFAQLSIQHGLDTCFRTWGNEQKFSKEDQIKLKKMIDHLLGFDSTIDKLRVNSSF